MTEQEWAERPYIHEEDPRYRRRIRWVDRLMHCGIFCLFVVIVFSFTSLELVFYIAGIAGILSCVASIGLLVNARNLS